MQIIRQLFSASILGTLFVNTVMVQGAAPLDNPSFERGMPNWSHWAESEGCIAKPSSEEAWDGGMSLNLSNMEAKGKGRMTAFQTVKEVEPNAMYQLSAWVKSNASPLGSVRVGLKLEFYNAEGKNVSGVNGFASLLQGADWERVSAVAKTGADVASVRIYLRLYTKGSVFFDNVELTQPELVIDEPVRLVHVPGEPVPVRIVLWANTNGGSKDLDGLSIEATNQGKTTSYKATIEELGENRYAASATLPPITSGHYELNVKNRDAVSERTARTFPSPPNRKPSRLSDTGTIIHNGKPFFPIGIYHPRNYAYYNVGGASNKAEIAEESYPVLAAHGFNAIQGSGSLDLDDIGRDLDLAHQHGLVVDVPFYAGGKVAENLPNSLEKLARFRNHPAVLNWKISDEPDIRPEIVDEVPVAYYALKVADTDTPIEVTLATDHTLDSWANFMDIIQIDRYPIPGGNLTAVSDYTRLVMASKAPWQNVSFVVQCGWSKDLSNQPSAEQARSMVYLALIEGAKGIWWYSMYDPQWDLTKTPLWPELKIINEEIHKLSEPLMLGEKVEGITKSNRQIYLRGVRHESHLYLLVTNPEETAQSTTIRLNQSNLHPEVVTLSGEPSAALIEDGLLKMDLKPLESKTLIFSYSNP